MIAQSITLPNVSVVVYDVNSWPTMISENKKSSESELVETKTL